MPVYRYFCKVFKNLILASNNKFLKMKIQDQGLFCFYLNNLKIFRQNRVSGVFACLSAHTQNLEVYEKMSDRDIPVVFFDIVPKENKYTKVRMADERCATLAAEEIIKRNAKKVVAIFGEPNLSISQKRRNRFFSACGKKDKHF